MRFRKWRAVLGLLCFAATGSLLIGIGIRSGSATVFAAEKTPALTAEQILEKAEEGFGTGDTHSTALMTITTSSGSERVMTLETWSKGTDKLLMKYLDPPQVKGTAILMVEGEIWMYFPRTGRIRNMGSEEKVMGSTFSFEDMSGEAFEDYEATLVGNEEMAGRQAYVLVAEPTESKATYSSVRVWVSHDDFLLLRVDYYKDGEVVRRLECDQFEEIGGRLRPTRFTMTELDDNEVTTIEYQTFETDLTLDDNIFTKRMLGK